MIKRQRNGFHALTSYFNQVTDIIICIDTKFSPVWNIIRADILRVPWSVSEPRRNEDKRRQWARFLLLPSNKRYIIPLLLGIFFSNMRPRPDNHTPPPPQPVSSLTFLNSIDTRKTYFYCQTFFITFEPSTTAQSIEQNNFIFQTRFFYLHVLAEFLHVLEISIISIIEVQTISPEELNMYLAEFIRSFRIKDR